ncbi:uncharacterized protein LOC144579214 [Callithrix jacchus]
MQGGRTAARRTAQGWQQKGSRAFPVCPRAPYPVSPAWALIGRDPDSWVFIGAAKCSSSLPPAPSCYALRPPTSKVGGPAGRAVKGALASDPRTRRRRHFPAVPAPPRGETRRICTGDILLTLHLMDRLASPRSINWLSCYEYLHDSSR